jgi:hypothetical protein
MEYALLIQSYIWHSQVTLSRNRISQPTNTIWSQDLISPQKAFGVTIYKHSHPEGRLIHDVGQDSSQVVSSIQAATCENKLHFISACPCTSKHLWLRDRQACLKEIFCQQKEHNDKKFEITSTAIWTRTLLAYSLGSVNSFSDGEYTGSWITSMWFTNWHINITKCRNCRVQNQFSSTSQTLNQPELHT